MYKKIKKIFALVSVMILAGCSSQNSLSTSSATYTALGEISSLSATQEIEFHGTYTAKDGKGETTMNSRLHTDLVLEPFSQHSKGNMNCSDTYIGQYSADLEQYGELNGTDENIFMYKAVNGDENAPWTVRITENPVTDLYRKMYNDLANGSLTSEMIQSGEDSYHLSATLYGTDLQKIVDAFDSFDLFIGDSVNIKWESVEIPADIIINKEDNLPYRITLDCRNIGQYMLEGLTGQVHKNYEIDTFNLSIVFSSYNTTSQITIPNIVKDDSGYNDIVPGSIKADENGQFSIVLNNMEAIINPSFEVKTASQYEEDTLYLYDTNNAEFQYYFMEEITAKNFGKYYTDNSWMNDYPDKYVGVQSGEIKTIKVNKEKVNYILNQYLDTEDRWHREIFGWKEIDGNVLVVQIDTDWKNGNEDPEYNEETVKNVFKNIRIKQ